MSRPRPPATADLMLVVPLVVGFVLYTGLLGVREWDGSALLTVVPAVLLTGPVLLLALTARYLARRRRAAPHPLDD